MAQGDPWAKYGWSRPNPNAPLYESGPDSDPDPEDRWSKYGWTPPSAPTATLEAPPRRGLGSLLRRSDPSPGVRASAQSTGISSGNTGLTVPEAGRFAVAPADATAWSGVPHVEPLGGRSGPTMGGIDFSAHLEPSHGLRTEGPLGGPPATEPEDPGPDFWDWIRTAGVQMARGAGSLGASVLKGLATTAERNWADPAFDPANVGLGYTPRMDTDLPELRDPRENPLWRAGERVDEALGRIPGTHPDLADSYFSQLFNALGQAGGFVAASALGGPAATAALGTAMGTAEATERAIGKGASLDDAYAAASLGGGIGLTEAIPIERAFGRLAEPIRNRVVETVRAALAGASEEAVQEASAQVMQNLAHRALVDPDTPILEGAIEGAAVGGGAGALTNLVLQALPGRQNIPLSPREEASLARQFERALARSRADWEAEQSAAASPVSPGSGVEAFESRRAARAEATADAAHGRTNGLVVDPPSAETAPQESGGTRELGTLRRIAVPGRRRPVGSHASGPEPLGGRGTAPASDPALAARGPIAGVDGRDADIMFPDASRIRGRYRVVEAEDLIASHDPLSFERNPAYPADVQGRDYHRDRAAQETVATETARLDPDRMLDPSITIGVGPPTVTPGGIVIGGNQRTMMMRRAADQNPAALARYREALSRRAAEFGVDPAGIASMRSPVLIRQITDESLDLSDPATLRDLNTRSDLSTGKVKDPLSDAQTRARRLTADSPALAHLSDTMEAESTLRAYLKRPPGRAFVSRLIEEGIIDKAEVGRFIDSRTNAVTEEGAQVIQRTLMAAAVGDADVIARAPAGVLRKLEHAVPAIVQLSRAPDYRVSDTLRAALELIAEAESAGMTLDDLLAQQSAFESRQDHPNEVTLARFLTSRNPTDVKNAFRRLLAASEEAARGTDMFGQEPPTVDETFAALFGPTDVGTVREQASLFGEPDAARPSAQDQVGFFQASRRPQGRTAALSEARQTVSLLQGKVDRGAASPSEIRRYEAANALIRSLEGRAMNADDVRRATAERQTDAPAMDERAGDLFGVGEERAPYGEAPGTGPIPDSVAHAAGPHPLTGKDGPHPFGAERNVLSDRFTAEEMEAARQEPRLTMFDTLEVLAARVRKRNYPASWKNTWGTRSADRSAWRDAEIARYYGTGAAKKERRAFIVMGVPAAGKSSAVGKRLVAEHGAKVIDSDDFKERIPEFDNGINAEGVHLESVAMFERTLEIALEAGDNVLLPIVGKGEATVSRLIARLAGAGYATEIHLVDLPTAKAQGRTVMRYYETGRFVDPVYIREVGDKPERLYDRFKQSDSVVGYSRVTTDVPFGSGPRIAERGGTVAGVREVPEAGEHHGLAEPGLRSGGRPRVLHPPAGAAEGRPDLRGGLGAVRPLGDIASGDTPHPPSSDEDPDGVIVRESRGTYDAAESATAPHSSSSIRRAIERAPFRRAPASQWAGYLGSQPIAAGELDWVGVNRFLDEAAGDVSREHLLDLIEEEGRALQAQRTAYDADPEFVRILRKRAAGEPLTTAETRRARKAMTDQLSLDFGSVGAGLQANAQLAKTAGKFAHISIPGVSNAESRRKMVEEAKTASYTWVPATGQKVGRRGKVNPEDVFRLLRTFRSPAAEYMHLLVVDADGVVQHHRLTSSGMLDTAMVSMGDIVEAAGIAARLGGAVYLSHNHPSGNPTPSQEDMIVTARAIQAIRRAGARFGGHIVMNHETATLIEDLGATQPIHLPREKATDWTDFHKVRVSSPEGAARLLGSLPVDERRIDVLLLSHQLEVIAFEARPADDLSNIAEWLPGLMRDTAAGTVVFGTVSRGAYNELVTRANALADALPIADVIYLEPGGRSKAASTSQALHGRANATLPTTNPVFERGRDEYVGIREHPIGRRDAQSDLEVPVSTGERAEWDSGRTGQRGGLRERRSAGRDPVRVRGADAPGAGRAAAKEAGSRRSLRVKKKPLPEPLPALPPAEDRKIGFSQDGYVDLGNVGRSVRGFLRRNFTSAGDLPATVFQQKIRTDGRINAQMRQVHYTLRAFDAAVAREYGRKPDEAALERINAALVGDIPIDSLPESVQSVVRQMRDEIDTLSRRLIDSGAIEGDLVATVESNLGVYARRSYRVHDDPDWASKVPAEVRNRAKAFLRAEFPAKSEEQIEGLIDELLFRFDSPIAMIQASKLGSKDLSSLHRRKAVPPEIRALWGEYLDPRVNYARSVAKMAHLIENHRFLEAVREEGLGRFLFEDPIVRDGESFSVRIAAEGSKVMAPLNGLYTTKEIRQAFDEALSPKQPEAWLRHYMKANGAVKFAKTILSPMTHVRNLIGNTGFAIANGHWRAGKAGSAFRTIMADIGVMDQQAFREYYQELQRLGVVHESAHAGELRDVIRDANGTELDDFVEPSITGKVVKLTLDAAQTAYRAEDDVWKIYAFENELARYRKALPDASEQELKERVADIVRNTYPTYSLVPRGIRAIRRSPLVGAFVSFPAEVARTLSNTLRLTRAELSDPALRAIGAERLAGLLAAAALAPTAAAAARMLAGVTADDEEDVRRFLPPWSENSTLLFLGRSDDGTMRYIDLSYTDPYSYLRQPITAMLRGDDPAESIAASLAQVFGYFGDEEILLGKLLDIARNTTRDGRPVYNPQDSSASQLTAITNHVWEAFEPGAVSSAKRIYMGITGTQASTGRSYDARDEIMAVMTELRIAELDLPQSLYFRARGFDQDMVQAQRVMSTVAHRRGRVTERELERAYLAMERSRHQLFDEIYADVQAARRLGLPMGQVRDRLIAAGVSQTMAVDVLAGRYQPYEPTERFLTGDVPDASWRRGVIRQAAVKARTRPRDREPLRRRPAFAQ